MEKKTKHNFVVRIKETKAAGRPGRYSVGESRGEHFRKTLLLAGALATLALGVYFFEHRGSVQTKINDSIQPAAASFEQ